MKGPIYVDWAITNRCNLRCTHCVGMNERELSHSEILKVAQDIIELSPRWVILEGGETLLCDDIHEVGRMMKKEGIDVFVITNGNAFTQELLRKLASFSPKILFSIDGADAATYENIKRGGKFDVAIEWMERCANIGLFYGITAVLSKINLNQTKELIKLTQKLGGKEIIFIPLKPFGEDEESLRYYHQYALSPEEQEEAVREIFSNNSDLNIFYDEPFCWNLLSKHGFSLSHIDGGITIPDVKGCAASYSLYIQTDGDVRPCMFSPQGLSFGNASKEPLNDIWLRMKQSEVLTRWADQSKRKGFCGKCHLFESCRGCLARTVMLLRDNTASDPCCILAKNKSMDDTESRVNS